MTNLLLITGHLLLTAYAALPAWASLLDSRRDMDAQGYDVLSFYLLAIAAACTVISLFIRNRKWAGWLFLPFAVHALLTWYCEAELHLPVASTDTLILHTLALAVFYTLLFLRVNGRSAWSELK